jgi:hypothetical protein
MESQLPLRLGSKARVTQQPAVRFEEAEHLPVFLHRAQVACQLRAKIRIRL